MCQNFFKYGTVYRKQHIGHTMENEIKELEPIKAYKYSQKRGRKRINAGGRSLHSRNIIWWNMQEVKKTH
jgi:hypothetical protein